MALSRRKHGFDSRWARHDKRVSGEMAARSGSVPNFCPISRFSTLKDAADENVSSDERARYLKSRRTFQSQD